jgi:hypothetical protein
VARLRAQTARADASERVMERRKAAPARKVIEEIVIYALLPIGLLWLAHYLIIVLWDQATVYLRIVSIVLPMPFGFVLVWREWRTLAWTLVVSAAVSVMAIAGMLIVMHVNFQDTILPSSTHDLIEELQYFTSIALAFITGGLLALLFRSTPNLPLHPRAAFLSKKLAPVIASMRSRKIKGQKVDVFEIMQWAHSIQRLVTAVIATATTAGSIYTGVTSVMH